MKNIFAEIRKVDDEQRMVYGYASTEAMDVQGEIVTKEAMAAALGDYMKFANIREMHQPSAVGVAKSAEMDDKGCFIAAHVVDDSAWAKVKAGVYKGFSIGGKAIQKVEGIISSLRLTEISLVDRPANPEALITVWKADGMDKHTQDAQPSAIDVLADLLNKGDISAERLAELAQAEIAATASAVTDAPAVATATVAEGDAPAADAAPADDATKSDSEGGDASIAKGMEGEEVWDAARALQALDMVMSLLYKEKAEDEKMPEQIDALNSAVAAIKAFIVSEIQEDNSEAEKSDAAGDVAKAGRMISAANMEKLQAVHDACVGMGCKCDMGKSDSDADIAKADAIAKVADLESNLQKMTTERDTLKGELETLKKSPAPAKALLKAVTVAKSDDASNSDAEPNEALIVKDAHGNVNDAASLIKMIHQSGGAIAR